MKAMEAINSATASNRLQPEYEARIIKTAGTEEATGKKRFSLIWPSFARMANTHGQQEIINYI